MVFDDIAGQKNATMSLKNSILCRRIAHAYLFSGPDGVGKSIAASIFAAALNCSAGGADPCGSCPSCIKAQYGNHPDIIHIKTQKSSISVEDIRDLQMDMQKKPYEKGTRVYIIHDSQKMTEQAQNALLKILEEPPSHVVIILLTFNRHALLNTIVSRCRVLNFVRVSEYDIEAYIKSAYNITDKQAKSAAAFSDGIVDKAVEFLEDNDFRKIRDEVIDLTSSLNKKDKLYVLSRVDYFVENKDRIDKIFEIMISWFRDIIIYQECRDTKYLMNLDRAVDIEQESIVYTSSRLNNIIDVIRNAARNIKSNVNYQLVIETMLLNIQEV